MKIRINWKRFFLIIAIVAPALILIDIVMDSLKHQLVWSEIFGSLNILQKIACGIIGGLFFAAEKK
jgi:hypothetical protein